MRYHRQPVKTDLTHNIVMAFLLFHYNKIFAPRMVYKVSFILLIMTMLCNCTMRQDITNTVDLEFDEIRASSQDISSDVLLHSAKYVPYNATGGCVSTFSEYWYGTQKNNIQLDEVMEKNGWTFEKTRWHKVDGDKHLFLSLFLYNNSSEIESAPLANPLPNDVLIKADSYTLVYRIVIRIAVNTAQCPIE